MKPKIFFTLILFISVFSLTEKIYSQTFPAYTLTAQNFQRYTDSLTFDVYILHTNYPESDFGFMGITGILNFNPSVSNGGDLTFNYLERNLLGFNWNGPDVYLSPDNNQLRFAGYFWGTGFPYQMSHEGSGTHFCKMSLRTSAPSMNHDSLDISWRRSNQGIPFTRMFAWVKNSNIEITTDSTHFVDFLTSNSNNSNAIINLSEYSLSQNYPNPFNPKTVINYELRVTGNAKLKVFDVLGNEVAELINEKQNAGSYSVEFDGSGFASGVYFYKLEAGEFSETKRMILLK